MTRYFFRAIVRSCTRPVVFLLTILYGITLLGCVSGTDAFTDGRLLTLCNESIPVCKTRASCILENGNYMEGMFPGGLRGTVNSEEENMKLTVRIYLNEMIYPGTEIVVQAYDPICGDLDEDQLVDIDLFDLAGDSRVLQFDLELTDKGDHLLQIFSDMSSSFILTTETH